MPTMTGLFRDRDRALKALRTLQEAGAERVAPGTI